MKITLSSILITTFICVGLVCQVSSAQDSGKYLFIASGSPVQERTTLLTGSHGVDTSNKNSKVQFSSSTPLSLTELQSGLIESRLTQKNASKGAATVSISPATISVDPQGTGSFVVMIESGVTPVGAFDIDISWTPGIFTINSVTAGSSSEFGNPIANINNSTGKLTITGFQYSSLIHPVGSFSVATINCTSGMSGSTLIDLSVQELSDTNGAVFTTTSVDGSFSVGSGSISTPTPTPTQSFSPTATATAIATNTPTPSPTLQQATPTATPKPVPTAVNSEADLDGDGKIGPGDLLLLMNDWGCPIGTN